jgi:hypothetical protein
MLETNIFVCAATEGRFDINIALRRPTWQQTTYFDSFAGRQDSSFAVDGNFSDTSVASTTGCCSNPWWAVDLGAPAYVSGIIFANVASPSNGKMSVIAVCKNFLRIRLQAS